MSAVAASWCGVHCMHVLFCDAAASHDAVPWRCAAVNLAASVPHALSVCAATCSSRRWRDVRACERVWDVVRVGFSVCDATRLAGGVMCVRVSECAMLFVLVSVCVTLLALQVA